VVRAISFVSSMAAVLLAAQFGRAIYRSHFERGTEGKVPVEWKEQVGEWRIVKVDGHKVLAQRAQSPDNVFNLIFANLQGDDLDVSVKFKAVAGKLDQGGGLAWRAKDKNNYYVARYNPLEDNYSVYRVQAGKLTMFKSAAIRHTPGWHTLGVSMRGTHIECFYDEKKYLDCNDSTFSDVGLIGLWTKADAQTHFDDLTY
jgi:hypothetical protein